MTRTFISVAMPERLHGQLHGVIQQLAPALPSLRWVAPESIHLTLAFLGELDATQLAEVYVVAQSAAQQCRAFSYHLSRPNIFGSARQPRVLWMGLEETSGSLVCLHQSIQQGLLQHGFELEQRAFSPHFTLARGKAPLSQTEQAYLQQLLADQLQVIRSPQEYRATSVHVMESQLQRSGAVYICLRDYTLRPPLKG